MKQQTEKTLRSAVYKSLGRNPELENKYSIKECALNEYLKPDYDPFKLLEFTLMAYSVRAKYGFGKSD